MTKFAKLLLTGIIVVVALVVIMIVGLPKKEPIQEVWQTYTNDELGISFKYPKKYEPITVNVTNGEKGKEFRGYFGSLGIVFGGLTGDYAAGRDTADFDFSGYESGLQLKNDLAFDVSTVSTEQFEEIVTGGGVKGVRVQDLTESPNEFGLSVLKGETAYFFNLPKWNGGMEMKFNREKIPEFQEIIDSLTIMPGNSVPVGQTTTKDNPNGPDYQPNKDPDTVVTLKKITLGKEFTANLNEKFEIENSSGDVFTVTGFYYQPCPEGSQCLWSGLDVFYKITIADVAENGSLRGKIFIKDKPLQSTTDFPYSVTIKDSDYKAYAKVVISK